MPVKILSLSAYDAQSHRYWRQNLEAMFPQWQWNSLSLPPRHFSWRVRGNPVYWALEQREVLEGEFDVLLATSMVDLATLRGLVPALATVPTLLYFHENQFDYPSHGQKHGLLEAQMVSLYAALAADRVLFNSIFNRDSFLAGCEKLLKKLPDYVPAGVLAALRDKSGVLPVPVQLAQAGVVKPYWPGQQGEYPNRPLRLVWLGRFEYDKGAEGLCEILRLLESIGLNFELALVGQQFRDIPTVFETIRTEFDHRLVQYGYVEAREDYQALLRGADMALSTALHEFQGLAVLEAVAARCIPVVPGRQAYPEIYPAEYCYRSCPEAPSGEASAASELILDLAARLAQDGLSPPDVSAYDETALAPLYYSEIRALADRAG
jgi:glycosyltransferase involved in cell wall biosynthesis